jgi:dihydrodipicolinate synthase/N-acetylneuraminate lyase
MSAQPQATAPWRGVFAILCTPFHVDGSLDLVSLAREVQFCVDGGAHGIVTTVNASEAWTLTARERLSVVETASKGLGGALPLVVGVSGGSLAISAEFAKHAEQSGADAVIAMPPPSTTSGGIDIRSYYEGLADSMGLPVMVQNHDAPLGTRMTPQFVSQLVKDIPGVSWVKEEVVPPGPAIDAELSLCGDELHGILSGMAGRYILEDYARGARGTMPACEAADVHARVWNLLEEGKTTAARDLFDRLLPLLNYEAVYSGTYKTVLHWRGVLETSYMRNHGGNPLDGGSQRELRAILDRMSDLFVGYPVG